MLAAEARGGPRQQDRVAGESPADEMLADELTVRALAHVAGGELAAARQLLAATGPDPAGGLLRGALLRYLLAAGDGRVYEDPAAFQAFISGGGNVALYQAASAALAATYTAGSVTTVLDIGSGDGRTVIAAAQSLGLRAPELDLVEPSAALLRAAEDAARGAGLRFTGSCSPAQEWLRGEQAKRWDLAEATFSMHAIPPADRTDVLSRLNQVADAIILVEFDLPAFADRSPEQLRYLATRYEQGIREYREQPLVVQGFLMPVLAGQLSPDAVRSTWEQPAAAWVDQLEAAGWANAQAIVISDYWWAPAVAITASGGPDFR